MAHWQISHEIKKKKNHLTDLDLNHESKWAPHQIWAVDWKRAIGGGILKSSGAHYWDLVDGSHQTLLHHVPHFFFFLVRFGSLIAIHLMPPMGRRKSNTHRWVGPIKRTIKSAQSFPTVVAHAHEQWPPRSFGGPPIIAPHHTHTHTLY